MGPGACKTNFLATCLFAQFLGLLPSPLAPSVWDSDPTSPWLALIDRKDSKKDVPHWADAFVEGCVAAHIPTSLTYFVSSTFRSIFVPRTVVPHASAMHSHLRSRDPNLMTPSRKAEDDPEYAKMHWARSQKEMLQADEVSMRLYSELDLLEAEKHPHAPRGSRLHVEMVSDAVKTAMSKDEQIKRAMAADKDVFQMFRTKSDADLAEVGLKRVESRVEK